MANRISESTYFNGSIQVLSAKNSSFAGSRADECKGQYIIKKLFQAYYSHPQQLPDSAIIQYMIEIGQYKDLNSAANRGIGAVRVKFEKFLSSSRFTINNRIALMRKICDHIAGMTDHLPWKNIKTYMLKCININEKTCLQL